jgi:hypothetical protein
MDLVNDLHGFEIGLTREATMLAPLTFERDFRYSPFARPSNDVRGGTNFSMLSTSGSDSGPVTYSLKLLFFSPTMKT